MYSWKADQTISPPDATTVDIDDIPLALLGVAAVSANGEFAGAASGE